MEQRKKDEEQSLAAFLEQDKDMVMAQLSADRTQENAVRVLEKETDRLMYRAGAFDARKAPAAQGMLQVLKSALPLTATVSEVQTWEKSAKKDAGKGSVRPPALSVVCGIAGILCVIAGLIGPGAFSGFTRIFQVLWTAAGCALLLAGGYLAGRGRRMEGRQKTGSARARDEEIQQTFLVDQARIWHILQGTLLGADHSLETARELFAGAASEDSRDASGSLKKADLQFFCELLENAYALRRQLPQDAAIAEQVESIRYFLHERGIETVDYSRQDGKWFELLPGDDEAVTIRPAFLQDSVVVMRGIASGH